MNRTAKIAIGVLALGVLIMGAVLLGQSGQKKQRALTMQAIERALPAEVNKQIEAQGVHATRARCVRRSDRSARCVLDTDDGPVAVSIDIDPDTGQFLWRTAS